MFGWCDQHWKAASLRLPDEVREFVGLSSVVQNECISINEVIGTTDVLYVTRVQKERFESEAEFEATKDTFVIDRSVMQQV